MGRTRAVSKSLIRLLTAAVAALLSATSVHGAASEAAPAGAMGNAHASIGAAHFPQGALTGRTAETNNPRAAVLPDRGEELGPPTEQQVTVAVGPHAYAIAAPARPAERAGAADSQLTTRTIGGAVARAPPVG